jgi:acyl carrier protein
MAIVEEDRVRRVLGRPDLEADLGVDTIKQAQVMGKIRETFALPKDQNIRVKDFPTLRHVVQYVEAKLGTDAADTSSDRGAEGGVASPAVSGAHVGSALAGTPVALPPTTPPPSWPATPADIAVSATDQSRGPEGVFDDRVLETVLGIIEKQTGYERDALEPDLDLEADLGIDTIKQAQVMARLREAFDLPREQGIRVKDFPTIRHIVGYITSRASAGASPAIELPSETDGDQVAAAPSPSTPPPAEQVDAQTPVRAAPVHAPSGIGRLAVQWAPHPLSEERPNLGIGPGWTVLLTDDGLGVADALAQLLIGAGARAEILRQDQNVAAARARLGSVRAFIALHPLAADPAVTALDGSGWRAVLDRKVIATFRAIKALRSELELTVGVTAMAGPFGWRGQLADPAGSGVTGLLKSLRQESDAMLVKAVDVERPETREEAVSLAQTIAHEIERGGARVEVRTATDAAGAASCRSRWTSRPLRSGGSTPTR